VTDTGKNRMVIFGGYDGTGFPTDAEVWITDF
jgi:hypothetical protein